MDEILMEILSEVKSLAIKHAEIGSKLDAALMIDDRQEKDIQLLKESVKSVHEHGVIIKAMLWVYGIVVSLIVSREIGRYI